VAKKKKKAKPTPNPDAELALEVNKLVQALAHDLLSRLEKDLSIVVGDKHRWLIGSRVINLLMMKHYTETTEALEKSIQAGTEKAHE
jgi:hypothetical protein